MPRIILAFVLVMARVAFPCSCGDQRPCGKVVRSSAVFTGLTLSGGDGWKSPTARFRVIQAFKGVKSGAVVEIDTASQTSCAAQFQIGKEYIVYAAGTGERLSTTACSGSRLTAEAQQEIQYLNAWQQRKTPTEVLGYVIPDIRGKEQDWKRAYLAMGKAQVRVVGRDGRSFEVHPDGNGEFALRVPSSGPYQVSVSLPKWIANRPMETVGVPEFGCGETGFQMRPDGQVAGRAISKNGDAVRDVLLKLVPMSDFGLTFETTTDKEGHFRFRGVLPGAYRLGVNPDNMDDPSPSVSIRVDVLSGSRRSKHSGGRSYIRITGARTRTSVPAASKASTPDNSRDGNVGGRPPGERSVSVLYTRRAFILAKGFD